MTATATVIPAMPVTTATAVLPTATPLPAATATVMVDGPYEGTYFRGFADAPITLIDYSDFL
jgi:hypothetical protein